MATWAVHLRNGPLTAGFGIGFCILFAFIGTFTYVNFVLTRPPLSLGPMQLGFVYFVFLPSIFTTRLAGAAVKRYGTQTTTLWGGLAIAALGPPLLVTPSLVAALLGMVLVGVGTFFAQATATGFVSRGAATADRGAPAVSTLPHTSRAGSLAARSWAKPSTASAGWLALSAWGSRC